MKLTKEQVKDLERFAQSVDSEGFDYACSNFPLEDKELYGLICEPVQKAEDMFTKLCRENDIECGD